MVTTELHEEARRLSRLFDELSRCRRELSAIDLFVDSVAVWGSGAPFSLLGAERAIDDAFACMTRSLHASEQLATALSEVARWYSVAEERATRASQSLAAGLGYGLGLLLPTLALFVLPGISALAAGLAFGYSQAADDVQRAFSRQMGEWIARQRGALSDPRVVDLVRLSVMSVDDLGAGLVRLPPGVAALLGDEGLGVTGPDTSAMLLVGTAGRFGVLAETAVRVDVTATAPVSRSETFEDRVSRVPTEGAQIRIDRVSERGSEDRFEVYLGGTADFSLTTGAEPFDMTSNVTAIAGGSAGSYRAATEAMALAGVGPASAVVFTGYSQGGLIAARLAASGDYNTKGLYTLGAPAGQVSVPKAVPYVALEHTEDIVPATGGTFATSVPVLVRRSLFDGVPPVGDVVFPAHRLSRYRETAALLDKSTDPAVVGALRSINGTGAGTATVTSTLYRARRE